MNTRRDVPDISDPENLYDRLHQFVEIVKILRTDCPWDREQTHDSISHLLIEEAYETIDAIKSGNDAEFRKELGDILLHVVMHSVLAEERGAFTLKDVVQGISEKLVHRHPHVFGDEVSNDASQVLKKWESQKMKEGRTSILEGVPRHVPGLLRAQRMQEKAAGVGFDWDNRDDVWNKVEEELRELKHEIQRGEKEKTEAEFGDFFFALVNAARFENIVAEEALQQTNAKFARRFQFIEERVRQEGRDIASLTLGEMDAIWDEAKRLGL
ncbi:MAG: nucleoside triphosphate pyrophosphohydrolase [Candidatus Kapabacteria bacterium]|nr:nucleoside triphosphate pyrophosphohydrolase [Candidatus Kapabacteria bacterium]